MGRYISDRDQGTAPQTAEEFSDTVWSGVVALIELKDLWDAWERIKTLVDPCDKKKSMNALVDRISTDGPYRAALDTDAKELTPVGNQFHIRHSEVDKTPLESSTQVDYLFHRMFAMIRLLLGVV